MKKLRKFIAFWGPWYALLRLAIALVVMVAVVFMVIVVAKGASEIVAGEPGRWTQGFILWASLVGGLLIVDPRTGRPGRITGAIIFAVGLAALAASGFRFWIDAGLGTATGLLIGPLMRWIDRWPKWVRWLYMVASIAGLVVIYVLTYLVLRRY